MVAEGASGRLRGAQGHVGEKEENDRDGSVGLCGDGDGLPGIQLTDDLGLCRYFTEEDLDETLFSTVHHRPEELELLEKSTKFTRKEIQIIYRSFKQVSFPEGATPSPPPFL